MSFKITITLDSQTQELTINDVGVITTADAMTIKAHRAAHFIELIRQLIQLMKELGWTSLEIETVP